MNVPTAAELAAALAKDPDGLNEFADLTSTANATEEPAAPPSLIKCELTGHMATITLANDRRLLSDRTTPVATTRWQRSSRSRRCR
jgi:hypothetical protein